MVTFDETHHYSQVIDENEFFKQYYNKNAKYKYDSNFMKLKFQPILEEFHIIESLHIEFSEQNGLNHIKFYWPENTPFTLEIVSYFSEFNYQLETLELYQIKPEKFIARPPKENIVVNRVNDRNIDQFKEINYRQDLDIGLQFAQEKQSSYDDLFNKSLIQFYMAYIGDEPAGGLTLIESKDYLEIDSLFTVENYRKLGVATELQKKIMEVAIEKKKEVILLADGEDSPRNMYRNQGYEFISYTLGAQYIFNSR